MGPRLPSSGFCNTNSLAKATQNVDSALSHLHGESWPEPEPGTLMMRMKSLLLIGGFLSLNSQFLLPLHEHC